MTNYQQIEALKARYARLAQDRLMEILHEKRWQVLDQRAGRPPRPEYRVIAQIDDALAKITEDIFQLQQEASDKA